MALERLHMDPAAQRYHSYEAAAHVARYAVARPFCAGRRVLDIACGEGYGASLLASWGAREVIGIDLSAEAVGAARMHFSHPALQFLCGDAMEVQTLLAGEAPFDLIISLETVEHVANSAAFLAGLRRVATPDAVIVVSCPNDPAMLAVGENNPFHQRRFTFDEFRALAEAALGPAQGWLIETPTLGFLHYAVDDGETEMAAASPADIVRVRAAGTALLLPAQAGTAPSSADCHAYVGVWGSAAMGNSVITPLSHSAYIWPWRELSRLEAENRGLRVAQQADRRQLLRYGAEIAMHPEALREAAARETTVCAARDAAEAEAARLAEALRKAAARETAVCAARDATEAEAARLTEALRKAEQRSTERDQALVRAEQRLLGIERSRFYALMRAYIALYELPLIGPPLLAARRGTGSVVRALRGR